MQIRIRKPIYYCRAMPCNVIIPYNAIIRYNYIYRKIEYLFCGRQLRFDPYVFLRYSQTHDLKKYDILGKNCTLQHCNIWLENNARPRLSYLTLKYEYIFLWWRVSRCPILVSLRLLLKMDIIVSTKPCLCFL